ncbi:MAG: hypothetical protein LQ338_000078 [Usnochroma carphineum]|nr:MAG: hypothetical protein LQ338_000078 [Usnochroma carphineum]
MTLSPQYSKICLSSFRAVQGETALFPHPSPPLLIKHLGDKVIREPLTPNEISQGVCSLPFPHDFDLNKPLNRVMRALFENIAQVPDPNSPNGNARGGGPTFTGGFPGLHQLFASVLNPANAQHGDVVYSEEALDRIISQFMEAQSGSSAPGPASEAAIDALPKRSVDKDMLGSEGKAECSVCMDNVDLGDEVTLETRSAGSSPTDRATTFKRQQWAQSG